MEEKLKELYERILKRFPMGREASYIVGNENPSRETVKRNLVLISKGFDSDRRYTDEKSKNDAVEFIEEMDKITEQEW